MTLFQHVHKPAFTGATEWLNTEPLGPAELRDHVVVVNFWTFTCINWLRQMPYVRAWSHAYRHDGLVIVGVHTPEFSFEHDLDRVEKAMLERAIDYPVAVDNDYEIWNAFSNRYWPALYFVDTDDTVRDEHFGEGRYEESEHVIQRLLGVQRALVAVSAEGIEAQADWHHLLTPETYLGYAQGDRFASPNIGTIGAQSAYEMPTSFPLHHWALSGRWTIGREFLLLDQSGGAIACRFHARDAHLVLSRRTPQPIPFRVFLDGQPPGHSRGVDVDEDGNGTLDDGRLYQLVRAADVVRERTVEIIFLEPGAEAYVFTFG
jgi:hypothetical protein